MWSFFDATSLSHNWILALHEDGADGLWVGTHGGLNRLDPATGHVARYEHDPRDAHSLSHDLVWAIHEDRDGMLWIGTERGLNRFDRTTGRFTRYVHDPEDSLSLSNDRVYALHEDRLGRLWVSTANGLNRPISRFVMLDMPVRTSLCQNQNTRGKIMKTPASD